MGAGAGHPAMNPFTMPANADCRKTYSRDMCVRSLEILDRTVMVATHPDHTEAEIADLIHNIDVAARVALGAARLEDEQLRATPGVDAQKFDLKLEA
jgi:hypothetical protein